MAKIPIYFMPGLAAGPEIFENLNLSKEHFDLNYLSWLKPISVNEKLTDYAKRMCKEITHDNPVLVGVSFGGILVQEISKVIACRKVIIISSVKSNQEFPTNIKLAKKIPVHKLFPTQLVQEFEKYTKFFVGKKLQTRAELYKKYLSVRDKEYLDWALDCVVNWAQSEVNEKVVHIHGTKDHIFPISNIKDCIQIQEGTHAMILIKAKPISKIISDTILD